MKNILCLSLVLIAVACAKKEVNPSVVNLDAIPDDCFAYRESELGSYIKMGQVSCVKHALVSGVDGNGDFNDTFWGTKKPLLAMALEDDSLFFMKNSEYGAASIVALLLTHGGDVNRTFADGQSFLEKAVRIAADSEPVTMYVVSYPKVNVNQRSVGGFPSEIAVELGREAVAKAVINAGADVNVQNAQKESLLHRTVVKRQREVFQLLLSKGARVDTQDMSGTSPLISAVTAPDDFYFNELLKANANIGLATNDGTTALYFAVSQALVDRAQALLGRGARVVVVSKSTGNGLLHVVSDVALAEKLVGAGCSIETLNNAKESPLASAVISSKAPLVTYLLNKGANFRWTDSSGRTLLHIAVSNNTIAVVQSLIQSGANVSSVDQQGAQPIAFVGSVEVFDALTIAGADPLSKDDRGLHAFSSVFLSSPGNLAVLKKFVEKGAKPDEDVALNVFPLQRVIQGGFSFSQTSLIDVIAFLVDAGANPDRLDRMGNAPVHYTRDLEVVTTLANHGANLSVRDGAGRTLRMIVNASVTNLTAKLEEIKKKGEEKAIKEAEASYGPLIAKLQALEAFLIEKGAQ
ncbi:MAG: ankyrin repeat domain-containing protein [Deltaproteobacteria bacterium]|nr:ankyrin repeat domain-containing protein [Deltaproteobacteria bacterium]MBI3293846.1 ankyrin repeat domain-containing protein [Deltaproteobacteria bacterium]